LEPTYLSKDVNGNVVIFELEGDAVEIFRPNDLFSKRNRYLMSDWERIKPSYDTSSDVSCYNDVINAAWQCLVMQTIIKKDTQISKHGRGKYFPRIWRGINDGLSSYEGVDPGKTYGHVFVGATVAVLSILQSLESLFKYIEPAKGNLGTFSHKIRETLILVCTEVESALRSVLDANSSNGRERYTTADYFKLADPMRLKEWAVSLSNYPELGVYAPFSQWDEKSPTKSLPWYDCYNAVKHHREEQFQAASLDNLLNAAAALHILQSAQFGPYIYHSYSGSDRSPFSVVKSPEFDLSELYIPDFIGNTDMIPKLYFA